MANIGSRGTIDIFLDFNEDTLNADMVRSSLDGTGTNAITADAIGGVLALTTDSTDDSMGEVGISQPVRAQDGPVFFEAKAQISGIATVAFTVSLTDDPDEGTNTLPVELATATFTTNASTGVGVVFDTDATTDNFYFWAVDDDADTSLAITELNTGLAPTAAEDFIVRIELYDRGSSDGMADAVVTILKANGTFKQKRIERAVDRDAVLYGHCAVENRTTSPRTLSIDYMHLKGSRA